jgi:hypothetical protein
MLLKLLMLLALLQLCRLDPSMTSSHCITQHLAGTAGGSCCSLLPVHGWNSAL